MRVLRNIFVFCNIEEFLSRSGHLHAHPALSSSSTEGWPGSTFLFFFFYTNLLHVSETFFKGVYSIWLFVTEKIIILPKAFDGLLHLKKPSLSPVPPQRILLSTK